jgi:hypothetical protein
MAALATGMARIRSGLRHPVSVQALIEIGMWFALPYLVFGFYWTVIHPDKVQALQAQWSTVAPVGADIAAIGEATILWPAVLLIPTTCGVAAS